jgi:hypothetical protein
MADALTILTRPPSRNGPSAEGRRAISSVADRTVRRRRSQTGARGPESVLASLRRGLAALRLPFDLNPRRFRSARTLGVLSDLEALEAGIAWRRVTAGGRLIAGPNLVVLPSDAGPLMTAEEIDLCLVPSEWVRRYYEADSPALAGRIEIWPAGVDAAYWSPDPPRRPSGRRALLIRKLLPGQVNASDVEIAAAGSLLRDAGFEATTLEYGSFKQRDYRAALRSTDLVVYFSPTESQCIAMVEAWAVGVPTFVWSCGRLRYRDEEVPSSSAPYLSERTGRFFENTSSLGDLLSSWEDLCQGFRPREWVLEHMTDQVCARAYWDLAQKNRGAGL